MSEKEPVQDGLAAVGIPADAAADVPVVLGQFLQIPHGTRRDVALAENGPPAGVGQKEMPGFDAALRNPVPQPDFGENVAPEAHRHRLFVNPEHGFAVFDDPAPPRALLQAQPIQTGTQFAPWGGRG
jgi:hypothetical protein